MRSGWLHTQVEDGSREYFLSANSSNQKQPKGACLRGCFLLERDLKSQLNLLGALAPTISILTSGIFFVIFSIYKQVDLIFDLLGQEGAALMGQLRARGQRDRD